MNGLRLVLDQDVSDGLSDGTQGGMEATHVALMITVSRGEAWCAVLCCGVAWCCVASCGQVRRVLYGVV